MNITRADISHINELATLFDLYRQFYEQPADLAGCEAYLRARLANDESIIFIAHNGAGEAVGFTQLYHSFCSVAMRPNLYLYDLFVAPAARRNGVGKALMNAAKEYGESCGVVRLSLQTAFDNVPGQTLYELLGYKRDTHFYAYDLEL